jgi:D-lactate dehydrogenase (cytochrome)
MIDQKTAALQVLERMLPENQIVTNRAKLFTYEQDASLDRGHPDGVVFPESTDGVMQIVHWAKKHGVPLVARGAGTGLSGGAIAEHGGIIVEFSRMKQVLELDERGRSAVVQPGVVNADLDTLVKAKGLYYPPDPSSGRAATIGGNIAENSGGPHCFKYGVTTNYVTGLEVVLADGRKMRMGGRALDYPEYDFVGVLNGSEGTLGIITESSVRLIPNPPAVKTLMAAFDSVESASQAVSAMIAGGLVPATMEMMDQKIMRIIEDYVHAGLPVDAGAALIVEVDGYPESVGPQIEEISAILRDQGAHELRMAQTAEEREKIWYARKSAAGAMARLAPAYYLVDGTVPRSELASTLASINQICEAFNLRVGHVFHAGDGNLHPLILIEDPSDRELVKRVLEAGRQSVELCVKAGGSITGEHGVGIEKRDFMTVMYNADELRAMLDIKHVFDPTGLLNPDKIFPAGLPAPEPLPDPSPAPASPFAPTSAKEAAEALRAWSQSGQRVEIRGSGTKTGNSLQKDQQILTNSLNGIHTYARDDLYVTVGAGMPLAELQAELARDRIWVPLVSPWAEATVGGIVATNFNAPLRMRYGGVRDLLLATTVALPNGRVVRAGRSVVKNVAGYDLPKLFAGSYGTLGLMADVTLKLAPLPRARASLIVPVDTLAQGLRWSVDLLRLCMVASSLLLCRGCDVPGISARYSLIYTAEGLSEDVAAELGMVRHALQTAGATESVDNDELSGSDVWATWLSSQLPRTDGKTAMNAVLRLGVAPKDLPTVLGAFAGVVDDAPFIADIANGSWYVSDIKHLATLRQASHRLGGYTVVLGDAGPALDRWGYVPESLDLMHALKARWDVHGVLNHDAFVV